MAVECMWVVELQAVIYLEPIDAQAHNLEVRLRGDERLVCVARWKRTPGALGGAGERRAMTTRCVVSARTRDAAAELADRVLGEAIEGLILDDPPGLSAPVLTEVGEIQPAGMEGRQSEETRAC